MFRVLTVLTGITAFVVAHAQPKKFFAVDERKESSAVHLTVDAKSGNYFIQPHKGTESLNVISNEQHLMGNYQLQQRLMGSIHKIMLELNAEEDRGLTQSLSHRMLGDESPENGEDCFWKVYLSESKPYRLDLDYAVGSAHADLSGLAVQYLNINTGSADVDISYRQSPNKIVMDTFHVNVDMGSLTIHQLSRARSRLVEAEVGFGKLLLDFSERPTINSEVHGTVGAGSLVILLPDHDVPVMVRITDSWFSSVVLPDDFREVDENIYANPACQTSKARPMLFDLDVAMGRIILRGKAQY